MPKARSVRGAGEVSGEDRQVQTSSYKINKSRGCTLWHREYSQWYCNSVLWEQMVTRLIVVIIYNVFK